MPLHTWDQSGERIRLQAWLHQSQLDCCYWRCGKMALVTATSQAARSGNADERSLQYDRSEWRKQFLSASTVKKTWWKPDCNWDSRIPSLIKIRQYAWCIHCWNSFVHAEYEIYLHALLLSIISGFRSKKNISNIYAVYDVDTPLWYKFNWKKKCRP